MSRIEVLSQFKKKLEHTAPDSTREFSNAVSNLRGSRDMLKVGGALQLSASDLVAHLYCRHLTSLDTAVTNGSLEKPKVWDPLLAILVERGSIHEHNYVEHLRNAGYEVAEIEGTGVDQLRADETTQAMRAGAEIIVQGAFLHDYWSGRTDILRRVDAPSALGDWSYEVVDTKLARETKGATVLQLCLYSDLLSIAQGRTPEYMHVVALWSGYQPQTFRTAAYAAYYRRVKKEFERSIADPAGQSTYPDPNEHCSICRWRLRCDSRRRLDDHLCLVAGITKIQINELKRQHIGTAAELAGVSLPFTWKPERGAVYSYERIREQARIQIEGRAANKPIYEVLPVVAGFGLASLPTPSAGDMFLDLEGDPFAGEGGMEYLFGYCFADENGAQRYYGEWALSRTDEKRVFEKFVDLVMDRWAKHPDLHIYHYAHYEPSALKRLMGRYATREEEIDRMLRASLFVDLYQVVRYSIRASVENYSIKELERLFGYVRTTALEDASRALASLQACLELGDPGGITGEIKDAVANYNRDDCVSAYTLRAWLERIRSDLIGKGEVIDRPINEFGEPSEAVSEWQAKIANLMAHLATDVPVDVGERSDEQQARWVLAHVLDWHRREEKALWWDFFRLSGLTAEDLLDEPAGLAGLTFVGNVGGTVKAPIHRYRFPPQETELRGDEPLHKLGGDKLGKVDVISAEDRTVNIKKRGDSAAVHPEAVFAHNVINTGVLANALVRFGEYVAENGIAGAGRYQAARDLLLREAPRIDGDAIRLPDETALNAATRIAPKLRGGVLPIQGPPGAGKTHIGARMICSLVKGGARVGITANSHKVIRNLLDEVVKAADENGIALKCIQKVAEPEDDQPRITFTEDNDDVFTALTSSCQVAAGTAWLWARPDAHEAVDVLFVDEAAQVSLANVLAVSQAATSLVLLGDPQQLDQPMQGSHPEGTGVSALDHILGDQQTISADQGLFLEETWRLHPDICAFTSEIFYENRLRPRAGLEAQEVRSSSRVHGTGLRYLPVHHQGNRSSSPEEADVIRDLVADILNSGTSWIDRHGREQEVGLNEILIIAPYNAQAFELQERIPGGRIGTVDKFQGQQAPIVIYSMTTSTHADAPRGMEFLYSLNRLNVATSRARCISILVGSPLLFEAECRTPRQIRMANAFCRYLEMATTL